METIHTKEACTSALTAVGDALYVVGGKWKLRIVLALSEGNKRFNEIQRAIGGISAKVLSNELKELETNGLIKRNVYTDTPVVVEYIVTEYSDSLKEVLEALRKWGTTHRERIRQGL
jgi:DNA-binding HxlR family transcriptional regulator